VRNAPELSRRQWGVVELAERPASPRVATKSCNDFQSAPDARWSAPSFSSIVEAKRCPAWGWTMATLVSVPVFDAASGDCLGHCR
jgi:hypothetical protein